MGYVDRSLTPGETVVYRTQLHWVTCLSWPAMLIVVGLAAAVGWVYVKHIAWAGPIAGWTAVACGAIGLASVFGQLILNRCSEFAVTNKRVIIKTGLIHRHTLEVILDKVESVSVSQTVLGRILGFGTLTVTGSGGSSRPYMNIAQPLRFRAAVQEQVELQDNDRD